jgi:predicted SprT family Zn-dependent metalloprotease
MPTILVHCECGAAFERTDQVRDDPESGRYACPSCGRELASWDSSRHPEYRFVENGNDAAEG